VLRAPSIGTWALVSGSPGFNQVDLGRMDRKQVEVTKKKDGDVVATVRDKLSSNGTGSSRMEMTESVF
jgi:hypothetical protein